MAQDKTKIFAIAADVLLAPAGTGTANAASWTDVGWCENGQTKLTLAERKTTTLHDGSEFLLNGVYQFEAVGLETDPTKISALEAFMEQDVDILLINRADRTQGYLLSGFTLIVAPDFNFNIENPRKIKLEAKRFGKKLGDLYSEVTGLTGF